MASFDLRRPWQPCYNRIYVRSVHKQGLLNLSSCSYIPYSQPLDLTVFGSLKTRYHQEFDKLSSLADDLSIKKRHFIQIYAKSRFQAFNERNLRSGFRAAGLVPFSPEKVLNSPLLKEITVTPQSNQKIPTRTAPEQSDKLGVPVNLNEICSHVFEAGT